MADKPSLTFIACFPKDHPDYDPKGDFHPDMLLGLVPDRLEAQADHDAIEDAKYPQTRCDVCQEDELHELADNGGLKMCSCCLEVALGSTDTTTAV